MCYVIISHSIHVDRRHSIARLQTDQSMSQEIRRSLRHRSRCSRRPILVRAVMDGHFYQFSPYDHLCQRISVRSTSTKMNTRILRSWSQSRAPFVTTLSVSAGRSPRPMPFSVTTISISSLRCLMARPRFRSHRSSNSTALIRRRCVRSRSIRLERSSTISKSFCPSRCERASEHHECPSNERPGDREYG